MTRQRLLAGLLLAALAGYYVGLAACVARRASDVAAEGRAWLSVAPRRAEDDWDDARDAAELDEWLARTAGPWDAHAGPWVARDAAELDEWLARRHRAWDRARRPPDSR